MQVGLHSLEGQIIVHIYKHHIEGERHRVQDDFASPASHLPGPALRLPGRSGGGKCPWLALRRHGKVAYGKCPGWRCAVTGRWRMETSILEPVLYEMGGRRPVRSTCHMYS